MTRNKHIIPALMIAMMVITTISCDKKSETDEEVIYTTSTTNALVKSFSLKADANVMANLDSVYFTIDPIRGLIYNADSLPVGTDVSHLLTSVTFNSTVATAEYYMTYTKNGVVKRDTIAYSSSSTDSLNFTGSTYLEVSSYDGTKVMRYNIRVNVHQVEPDTIQWPMADRRDLPGSADDNIAQRTVKWDNQTVCLLATANGCRMSIAPSPAGPWTTTDFAGGFTPDVNSLTASDEALYLLDTDGNLFTSTDAQTWTSTGNRWLTIIGGYASRVLGITLDGTPLLDEWPRRDNFTPEEVPANFPVRDMSQLVLALNDWAVAPQAVMVGGVLADGTTSNKSWGYDGQSWAVISSNSDTLPAIAGATLVTYYSYDINTTTLKVTQEPTWLLMGGFLADGTPNRVTYMSRSQGITWSVAADGLQWPGHMPSMGRAQAIIDYRTFGSSNAPRRISTPQNEWQCPYIYLFGGYTADGKLLNNIWCGVLTRMTFKPLY